MSVRPRLGPVLYGSLFVLVVPAVLVAWAWATEPVVDLPVPHARWFGALLAGIGLVFVLAGMEALWRLGRGLPMNAYPPAKYVRGGIYKLTGHPIYVGFVLTCFGGALLAGSASGLWLVSPVALLAVTALVLGYEHHDLRRRFGGDAIRRPLVSLPPLGDASPSVWDRASIFLLVFLPWTVAYEAVFRLGIPPDAVEGFLSFERDWPVLVWTEGIYASVYALLVTVPLVAKTTGVLRRFALTGLVATAVVTLIYVTVPVIAPPRPFVAEGLLGRMLQVERAMSHTVAAFPVFHVIWTLIAAEAWTRTYPRLWPVWWLWALGIAVSCVTTGMHALVDVLLGGALFPLLRSYSWVWERLRRGAEVVANSWHQWRIGPVRIINHGFWAGAAGAVGLSVAMAMTGPEGWKATTIVFLSGLLGAGLWAQRLEGSSKLSRPFGYYGSVIGCAAASLILALSGLPVLLPIAATATGASWIQAIGRGRCLVQGCCHGVPAPERIGIRYQVPNSRVLALSSFGTQPLHPTPLYSILANVVIGVLLLRLWYVGAALGLIGGLYLILAGIARFVEESYRGEPQTAIVGGLRLYQWTAIASVLAGMGLSSLGGPPAPDSSGWLSASVGVTVIVFGLLTTVAMGADLPASTRRYARLSG